MGFPILVGGVSVQDPGIWDAMFLYRSFTCWTSKQVIALDETCRMELAKAGCIHRDDQFHGGNGKHPWPDQPLASCYLQIVGNAKQLNTPGFFVHFSTLAVFDPHSPCCLRGQV